MWSLNRRFGDFYLRFLWTLKIFDKILNDLIIVKCKGSMKGSETMIYSSCFGIKERWLVGSHLVHCTWIINDKNLWKRFLGRLTGAVIILSWSMDLKHRGFFEASLWEAKVKQPTLAMCRQRHLVPQHFNVLWRFSSSWPNTLKP